MGVWDADHGLLFRCVRQKAETFPWCCTLSWWGQYFETLCPLFRFDFILFWWKLERIGGSIIHRKYWRKMDFENPNIGWSAFFHILLKIERNPINPDMWGKRAYVVLCVPISVRRSPVVSSTSHTSQPTWHVQPYNLISETESWSRSATSYPPVIGRYRMYYSG